MAGWPSIENTLRFAREFIQRHWRRALLWRGRMRISEEALHLILGALIGAIGAAASVSYYWISQAVRLLLFHSADDPAEIAARLSWVARVSVPVIGGVAAGLVLFFGLRLLGNPGLSNLLEVVVAGDGRMRLRPALLNTLASLTSISTGAPVGREGLIIQLSSTLASKLGQLGGSPPYRLRLMVACGAAAGIAAGCNAPIAGAVFAAQIVLGNFSMNLFAPLVVASVVAAIVPRTFLLGAHWFDAPAFNFTRLVELPWFPILGVLAGVAGAGLLRGLGRVQDWSNRLPIPLYARLGLAGLVVGLIALLVPEVWGNGFAPTNRLLHEEPRILFVLSLFAAKYVATTVTVGAGTVGGVFTPTLFLGAALGELFGALLRLGGWAEGMPAGCFALVGMGAMLSATTHSPLLAIIMIFELSLNYSIMPPLMLACAVSTLVARRLHPESIYTEPLRRKGLELDRESPHPGAATERTVGDLMREPVPPLRDNATFREIAQRFLTVTNNFLPVVDREHRLLGVVALQDLKMWLTAEHELSSIIASDVMRPLPSLLTPAQRLSEVLPVLLESELRNIPVVNNPLDLRLVGSVARAEALGLMAEAISARTVGK